MCEDSVKTVLIFLLAYGMGIGIYLSTRRNYRRGEEHGSAKWGDAKALNKKYRDKDPSANKLLTQNVRIGLDGKKHRRNLNILVCGGSGAGKTRFFCKPNAMQCNTSMVILDPKGEIVRDIGGHGVGLEFHEDPFVSYVTRRDTGMLLVPGMVFTIEPMINLGTDEIFIDSDNDWTVYTEDGAPSAQWEVTVAVTEDGYEILAY